MSVIGGSEIIVDINNLIAVIESCFANLCIQLSLNIQSVHPFSEEKCISWY